MADPNIQELFFNVTDPTGPSIGPIKSVRRWRLDLQKTGSNIGSYVLYDITVGAGAGPVLRSDKIQTGTDAQGNPTYAWKQSVVDSYQSTYNNLSEDAKKFLFQTMGPNADKKRADFVNSSYTQTQKNNLFPNMSGVRNTAPPAPPAPVKTPPAPATQTKSLSVSISDSNKVRKSYGSLFYPYELSENNQDRVQFTMRRYEARSIGTPVAGEAFSLGTRKNISTNYGTVVLPLQSPISDSSGVDWGGSNLNPFEAYAVSTSLATAGQPNAQAAIDTLRAAATAFADTATSSQDFKNAINLYLAQEAVGVKGLLSRSAGAIVNPNLELLFNGPTLRQFNFTFKLSANTRKDSEQINQIIRFFKQGSAIKSSSTEVFLKAPNVFDIKYNTYFEGKFVDHPSLNRVKQCALLSCDVDYTPNGSYMTFNDTQGQSLLRGMVSYTLTLKFGELTPVIEDDYFEANISTEQGGTLDIGF